MTRLDLDPDLERLGDALRASAAIDLAREEQAAHIDRPKAAGRAPILRRPKVFAGGTLGLAGVGAALVVALSAGGASAPPAFAVTRQADGSVLVKVNVDLQQPWVLGADRKLAAMGIDEKIVVGTQSGPAATSDPVTCSAAPDTSVPAPTPVKVLLGTDGTQVIPSDNTGAGTTIHLTSCTYWGVSPSNAGQISNTGNTGNG